MLPAPMITLVRGNVFDSMMQTITNPVNCVGVMGAGLALQFRHRFPAMFADYSERCRRGLVKLGEPYIYRRGSALPWILLFPTKRHWRDLSRKEDIIAGLKYLRQNYKSWGVTSLAVPPLGCGLGGLPWREIGPVLVWHLKQLDIPVEVYVP